MTGSALAFAALLCLASGPALPTYDEIFLSRCRTLDSRRLAQKLDRLLTTAFVMRQLVPSPRRSAADGLGPVLRTALSNVQTGRNFDLNLEALANGPRLAGGCRLLGSLPASRAVGCRRHGSTRTRIIKATRIIKGECVRKPFSFAYGQSPST